MQEGLEWDDLVGKEGWSPRRLHEICEHGCPTVLLENVFAMDKAWQSGRHRMELLEGVVGDSGIGDWPLPHAFFFRALVHRCICTDTSLARAVQYFATNCAHALPRFSISRFGSDAKRFWNLRLAQSSHNTLVFMMCKYSISPKSILHSAET
jgi:hypothetical protein